MQKKNTLSKLRINWNIPLFTLTKLFFSRRFKWTLFFTLKVYSAPLTNIYDFFRYFNSFERIYPNWNPYGSMWCSYLKYKKHISIGALTVASKLWKQRNQTFRMYSVRIVIKLWSAESLFVWLYMYMLIRRCLYKRFLQSRRYIHSSRFSYFNI